MGFKKVEGFLFTMNRIPKFLSNLYIIGKNSLYISLSFTTTCPVSIFPLFIRPYYPRLQGFDLILIPWLPKDKKKKFLVSTIVDIFPLMSTFTHVEKCLRFF